MNVRRSFFPGAGVALFLLLWATTARGLQEHKRFTRFSMEQGLSQVTVTSVLQDSRGFMWFGTQNGLNRFDGYSFVVYRRSSSDANSLTQNWIRSLAEDQDGILWIGTRQGGLNRFDPRSETFTAFRSIPDQSDSLGHDDARVVHIDSNGVLWVGTGDGLDRFDRATGTFVHYDRIDDSGDDNPITEIIDDGNGGIWVAGADGVHHLPQADQPGSALGGLGSALAEALYLDSGGQLWIGTLGDGVYRFDPPTGAIHRYRHDAENPHSISHDSIYDINATANGRILIAASNGMNILDPGSGRARFFKHQPNSLTSLGAGQVTVIETYADGMIWVGTWSGGVSALDSRTDQFTNFAFEPDNPFGLIFRDPRIIALDDSNALWVSSPQAVSLYQLEVDEVKTYQSDDDDPNSLSNAEVVSIHLDDENDLWIGSRFAWLFYLDRESNALVRYQPDPSVHGELGSSEVRAMVNGANDMLWVGTRSALWQFDRSSRTFVRSYRSSDDPGSLSNGIVYELFQDREGSLWVGTRQGLNRLDPGSNEFIRYLNDPNDPTSLSHDTVYSVIQDRQGTIWVSTRQGINRLNRENSQFERFGDDIVANMLEDESGRLWLSTGRGISRFEPSTGRFDHFDESDGCWDDYYNNSGFAADDGKLYFSGPSGITAFYPDQISVNSSVPEVVLTSFLLSNRPVAPGQSDSPLDLPIDFLQTVDLAYDQQVFTVEFSATGFGQQKRFEFRLNGFDPEWIATDEQHRRATYTNLDPGSYQFQVKAATANGSWGPVRELNLNVEAPPWRRWWAYLIYLILTIGIGGSFVWQRFERIREVAASEDRLRISLWGSNNQYWDWEPQNNLIHRSDRRGDEVSHFTLDSLTDAIHPDDVDQIRGEIIEHLEGRSPHIELTYRRKSESGDWTWVLDRGQVVARDDQNLPTRVAGIIQNIDELKEADEKLRKLNDELEERVVDRTASLNQAIERLKETQSQLVEAEKMASLGSLVTGMAHEINTPLGNAITAVSHVAMRAETARKATPAGSSADAQLSAVAVGTGIDMALDNLSRVSQLINSFKQIAADRAIEEPVDMDLESAIPAILSTIERELGRPQHQVRFECPKTLRIKGYPSTFRRIFMGLIENSFDHGFQDMDAGTVTVVASKQEGFLSFEYRDNGRGITSSIAEQIFEPFFTTSRGSGKIGLGMHITYNLVTQGLNGSITVDPKSETGALFHIKIPVDPVMDG